MNVSKFTPDRIIFASVKLKKRVKDLREMSYWLSVTLFVPFPSFDSFSFFLGLATQFTLEVRKNLQNFFKNF